MQKLQMNLYVFCDVLYVFADDSKDRGMEYYSADCSMYYFSYHKNSSSYHITKYSDNDMLLCGIIDKYFILFYQELKMDL